MVLAGHGAARSDATKALVRFSEKFGIPVASTFHGKGVMPDDHPNGIGTPSGPCGATTSPPSGSTMWVFVVIRGRL